MLWLIAETVHPAVDSSIIQLIGGLGQSAAAVLMAWLFIVFLQKKDESQEKRDARLFEQFGDLAKDRGQIIRDNTQALGKIEASVDRLTDLIDQRDIADRRPGQ